MSKLTEMTECEIVCLQAAIPELMRNAAPLVQIGLKRLVEALNDEQAERRLNAIKTYDESYESYTEPTAPKIKVGDMVIVKPDAPNMCKSVDVFKHIKSVVTKIENGKATLDIDRLGDGGLELFDVPLEYIQKVDAIEHLHNHGWGDLGEFTPMSMSANPIIGFEQSYWQRYEADLAKEIALKVANKYSDPKETAYYAVSVAKTVVENLKKK